MNNPNTGNMGGNGGYAPPGYQPNNPANNMNPHMAPVNNMQNNLGGPNNNFGGN